MLKRALKPAILLVINTLTADDQESCISFFWILKGLQSQTKELGHEASSPLPPLSMLIIR